MTVSQETTFHVRRAVGGDRDSVQWLAERLHAPLMQVARQVVDGRLDSRIDAEDLVQMTWLRVLSKLEAIQPRGGRYTPPMMRYLSRTVRSLHGELMDKHIGRRFRELRGRGFDEAEEDPFATVIDPAPGPRLGAQTREREHVLRGHVDALPEQDRLLLILRGFEQRPYGELAELFSIPEATLRVTHHRLLQQLRTVLPAELVDELGAGD